MANPENKQIPYESTQKDIRDAIESVATAIGGITHPDAEDIVYDNSVSGLSATDVQNAIDELESEKADSSSLATVATSGDYDDLINKPTIPTVNDATLTIQKNGSDVATFTANASSNVTANVTVPTTTSELTNNSDFVSDASYVHTDNNFTTAEKTKLGGIESGAEVNVQSDWNQTDNTKDDYIKNKPSSDVKTATDTFTTVNGGLLEECVIDLEPVQDLHGYSEPWVGGSKNEFELTATTQTVGGITFTVDSNNGTITLNGLSTEQVNINIGTYPSSTSEDLYCGGCPNDSSSTTYFMTRNAGSGNFYYADPTETTAVVDGTASPRIYVRSGVTCNNVVFKPFFCRESMWENICPISGHTEMDLQRDGKNFISYKRAGRTNAGVVYTVNDGVITANGLATARSYSSSTSSASIATSFLIKAGTYTLSGAIQNASIALYTVDENRTVTYLGEATYNTPFVVTLSEDSYVFYNVIIENGTSINHTFSVQLEKGSTATPYEPYLGHLYQVQIGSTVYGGTVDLVSGVMNVDRVGQKLQNFVWEYESTNGGYFQSNQTYVMDDTIPLVSSCYQYGGKNWANAQMVNLPDFSVIHRSSALPIYNRLRIKDSRYTTSEDLMSAVGNEVVVYALATPFTIQLTPQQIETLVGQNNLSTPLDGQSIDSVEYREVFAFDDVEKVVSLRVPISMLGTDESGRTTASQSYASGDYFYKDGKMGKALTSISQGATFTLNTNYSSLTLAEILKAIENA